MKLTTRLGEWMEESIFWGVLTVLLAVALGLGAHIASTGLSILSITTATLFVGFATWERIQAWGRP